VELLASLKALSLHIFDPRVQHFIDHHVVVGHELRGGHGNTQEMSVVCIVDPLLLSLFLYLVHRLVLHRHEGRF